MGKGQDWERTLCRHLSNWWTHDLDDSVFWRTSNSGGRATTRGKQNKTTFGQYGDIAAINPIGQPLIDAICFEAKKGYSSETIANLLDRGDNNAEQLYHTWFKKAEEDRQAAGAFTWLLIHKRDRREPVIFTPPRLLDRLHCMPGFTFDPLAYFVGPPEVDCIGFKDFFDKVKPGHIQEIAAEHRKQKKDAPNP